MTPKQQAFARDALTRLHIPPDEWDDYLDAIAGLIEAALDAHEAEHAAHSHKEPTA